MKRIRSNTFETNSSSCHSISIDTTSNYDVTWDKDVVDINMVDAEFGWGIEKYTNFETKLQYLLLDNCKAYDTSCDTFNYITKVVQDFLGVKSINVVDSSDSYIDHQSTGTSRALLDPHNIEDLKTFLFSSRSTLLIDNDNH